MILVSQNEFWLEAQSKIQPDKLSIITPNTKLTFSNFYIECCRISNHLENTGIVKNDYVGVLYGHSYELFVIVNALWFIGAVPVLLSTRETEASIVSQLDNINANKLLIDLNLKSTYRGINSEKVSFIEYDFIKNNHGIFSDNTFIPATYERSENAIVFFTSGSSAKPKAVVHTFGSLFESVKAIDSFFHLSENDTWIASLPLYHIGGFMIALRSLLSGSSVVYPNSLYFDDVINAFVKHKPTHASLVSTTLKRILDENILLGKNLKYLFLGGGPLDSELCSTAINKCLPIVKVYGSTETCSMITALHTTEFKLKSGSAGLPLDKSKIKIKIKNTDKEGIGEILIQSPTLFNKYLNDPISTEYKLINNFYHSGDYGWIDKDGYLFIDSRREDIIISGGENVSIKEVENSISNIAGIKECYVFSLPDEKWGQSVNAVIVPDEGSKISETEIRRKLRLQIASYKIPKKIFFFSIIPKTELGKINKQEVLKLINLNEL